MPEASRSPFFEKETFRFLADLEAHNDREWFAEHKPRYEKHVIGPALEFVRAMQPRLKKVSKFFEAIDKKVGGSIMRIYRDTRFSKDKTPYKTNVGIHFRHEFGADVHAPGWYIHLHPDECFVGAGMWMPETKVLKQLRGSIDADPNNWLRAKNNHAFASTFELAGESLKTAPQGFPKDHPQIEDLRRKSFIGVCDLSRADVLAIDFPDRIVERMKASKPLMRWLCSALDLPF
ncbi:DUF2461 domain-containing protein [Stratiformator vulcanicus]|uniref:TIGR02453 family protein n=1 Tax=Stratiformator vulcanicus TaxID=2527980 RepID=A0A517R3I8_9PLAN|nr:hypothetical protein Pan189_28590 [Stratiformator vulcanicus]